VPLGLFNDVFLQNFALEAAERTLDGFAIHDVNFSQQKSP
jgi:hypothetical protein